jgi:hypothetical protein
MERRLQLESNRALIASELFELYNVFPETDPELLRRVPIKYYVDLVGRKNNLRHKYIRIYPMFCAHRPRDRPYSSAFSLARAPSTVVSQLWRGYTACYSSLPMAHADMVGFVEQLRRAARDY